MKSTSGRLTSSRGRKRPALCSSYSIQKSESGRRGSSFQNRAINLSLAEPCCGGVLADIFDIEAREIRFRTTGNGKPELAGNADLHLQDSSINDLRFNLSHTQGVTVFAVARHRQVGVDVERIRQNTNALELAERFFSRPEVEWLRSQPASEHIPSFFSCWTAKEAYIKARGQGLSMSLSSFGVAASGGSRL